MDRRMPIRRSIGSSEQMGYEESIMKAVLLGLAASPLTKLEGE